MTEIASWYHANSKPVSRANGKSYVGLVAYLIDQPIYDEYNKRTCNRNHAGEVESWGVVAGGPCPASFLDKSKIDGTANNYELYDTRVNAHLSNHIDFALWRHGTKEQNEELTRRIAQRYADRYKVMVVYSVHAPSGEGSNDNDHGHLAPTTSRVTKDGFGEKARELQDGKTKKLELMWCRRMIAEETNAFLKSVNSDERVTHLSYRDRGILKDPMKHMGAKAWQAEKKSIRTERGDENRAIRDRNRKLANEQTRLQAGVDQAKQDAKIFVANAERLERFAVGKTPMELTEGQAQRREDEVATELGKMDRVTEDVSQWWQNHRREMEDAATEKRQKERDGWRQTRELEVADPMARWAEACGKYSDMRDPYGSLATAARAEGSIFRKQQEDLRQEEARESDPTKREMLKLQRHVEAAEYMSVTSERLAGISHVISGGRGNETEAYYVAEAIKYQDIADAERKQLTELRSLADDKAYEKLHEEVARLERGSSESSFNQRMNVRPAQQEETREQFFGVAQALPENAPNRDRPQGDQYQRPDHDPEHSWSEAIPGKVYEAGRQFRMNQETGQTEVRDLHEINEAANRDSERQNPYDRLGGEYQKMRAAGEELQDGMRDRAMPEMTDEAQARSAERAMRANTAERDIEAGMDRDRGSGMSR